MSAPRPSMNRYHSYAHYSRTAADADPSPPEGEVVGGREHPRPAVNGIQRRTSSGRLEHIINSMAYIRGELDGLKESDRVLLEIFKQLESNVSELTASLSMLRAASSNTQSPGRPTSFTDLDFNVPRSPFCPNSSSLGGFNGLETILDSSKEDISYKTSTESDSLYLAEQESSSNSCSPVLPPLKSHASIPSINSSTGSNGGGGGAPKRPANPSPPLLKTSTSFSGRLANSPSIARLQDETSSNISRNSSIDSGIQFASEAENGSAQGVEAAMHTLLPPPPTREESGEAADTRKSMGFADDIFATLGMK